MNTHFKKILVVRFSSIGDIVLTTPVVRCLREKFPKADIHYLTKKDYVAILVPNPYVHKVWQIDKDLKEILGSLRAEKFDFVVDLHHNLRTTMLKLKLGVKSKSFPKLNWKKFLLTKFKINQLPSVHIVDRYFETVKKLGVKNDHKGLSYYLTDQDQLDGLPPKFLAIVVGAKLQTKRMPTEMLIDVLSNISDKVILLGGKEDVETGKHLEGLFVNVKSFCGLLTLGQSAFVLSKSMAVLTGDTGLMHIAAAFKKPIVSVWGNTIPAFGMYPYIPNQEEKYSIHQVDLNCRPCSKIGYDVCPNGHFNCMVGQDRKALLADIQSRLLGKSD